MKTENMNSLEGLFTHGFCPAFEPDVTCESKPGPLPDRKPLKADAQQTASEVFHPASAASSEKSATIL
jgi:hypothetical protein